jgi:type I restriction enzyme, S subunit
LREHKPGYKLVETIFHQFEEIPDDWNFIKISEFGKIIGGGTPSTEIREYWDDGDITWYTPEDLTNLRSTFVSNCEKKITQKGLDNSSAKVLPKGTLLVSTRATLGNTAITTNEISTTNQGFQNIVCNNKHNVFFLLFSIRHNARRLLQYAQGTTFLEINKTNFGNIQIPCPDDPDEEIKIAKILSNTHSFIEKEYHPSKFEILMKGFMQQLLTGQKRVKV